MGYSTLNADVKAEKLQLKHERLPHILKLAAHEFVGIKYILKKKKKGIVVNSWAVNKNMLTGSQWLWPVTWHHKNLLIVNIPQFEEKPLKPFGANALTRTEQVS